MSDVNVDIELLKHQIHGLKLDISFLQESFVNVVNNLNLITQILSEQNK